MQENLSHLLHRLGTEARSYQSDQVRSTFLSDLDDADHIDLSEFETDFLGSNLARSEFTPRQRAVIDKMREKYGSRL